ncbi:exocyst complex component SEC5B-like isoform X2 [Magnolia sinica]|uniref:exocyst complex component SEC5B-like isoform X2 n=1 Tax=Magnolia sinica TaxID=86752 RepID=UPI00265AE7F9|nr:exocyst complex component SEC5B-like isoform X2 [Magnolia sinica]
MSSDSSDEMDEDELLQMALKEQAERDLNYHRPPSKPSKPVVNLLQPPPTKHHPKNSNPTTTTTTTTRHDDSEVELLSISSGDEDSYAGRDYAAAQTRAGVAAPRKGGRDDAGSGGNRRWDGEEPNCWKRVDESELGRRVREMRETRAAPVAQTMERKGSTLGRKGFTNLNSLSRGLEFVDPLGLGIIDNKSLTLINDASESSPVSRDKPDKDILDPSTREKLMYFSEQFDAKLFLSRIHQDTSAADLESGALVLKTDLKGRTEQKKQLVKENFDCFVSCKNTIDDIESKLKWIEEDPEGAGTANLYHAIHNVSLLANRAFEPLFERQVQAEKIRSVQGMLQRFRTLFNLPSAIRGSISKGEYDMAVREYRKAKSIVLPSHVGILKRVLEEAEKVMQEFKGMLYKSLEDPQLDLAELENTVRLLSELEPESDPVWHYLNIQNRRIRRLLEKCTFDHEAQMEALHNEIQERVLSDTRWRQIQQDSNKASDVDYSLLLGDSNLPVDSVPVDVTDEVDALRGRYIRRLTAVLINHLPAFWRLALSVFSGKFAKSSHASGNVLLDQELNVKPANKKIEDKVSDVKYSSHSIDEVAEMVLGTVSAYETKVHSTFQDFEQANILCPYMSDAIKEISKSYQAIEGKESAPPSAVRILRTLHMEITKIYIIRLCSWMRATTEEISKEELWMPISVLERNQSPYTISFMPFAFHSMTVSAMDQINLEKGEGDSDIQDLVSSFAALEEKILEQYTYAKANLIRTAAINYLLDAGVQWSGAPAVKGIRDAAVELLHTLVAVHAEVFAGAKPLLEKTLGILVEGLIDTFLSLFHENSAKDLKALDANGFCQLMLELEYFETILNAYFTPDSREALKSLQGLLLEKASESVIETSENPGHHRRPTRGSEEALVDDRQQGMTMSPDDLIVLAQQYSAELLQAELDRTRINIACFMEPLDSVPEIVKDPFPSFRGSLDSPIRNHRVQPTGSPSFSRQRRR